LRRKILIAAVVLVGVPLLVLLCLLLYLRFGDLNRHSPTVGRIVTEALGRELKIDGRFEPRIGFVTTVVAEDVSLANPEWSVERAMVHVDHLEASLDLRSLFSDELRLGFVEATGVRVALEIDAEGRASWDFDVGGDGDGEPFRMGIGRARIDDLRFSYHDADLGDPIVVDAARLETRSDPAGMWSVDLGGRIDDADVRITGELGTFNELISGGAVSHDLAGSIGGVDLTTRGKVERLAGLEGIDLTVAASGPDLEAAGLLADVEGLPAAPFDVSGRLLWSGFPCTFEDVEIRVGDNTASLRGVLGEPPKLLGTDFTFEAAGPDLAALGALAGADLPADSFEVAGRLVRHDKRIAIEKVEGRIGETTLRVDGSLGDPPEYDDTSLEIHARGPDLSAFRDLAGVDLPPEPFEVRGRLGDAGTAIALEAFRGQLGANRFGVDGSLDLSPRLVGTDLRVRAEGPSLAALGVTTGVEHLPPEPFSVKGGVRVLSKGYRIRGAEARVGEVTLRADGKLGPLPEIEGTDLDIHADGPDLSRAGALLDRDDLPAEPFRVDGSVAVLESGYELREIDARIGDLAVKADGRLGPLPELDGTSLRVDARLPKLSDLGAYVDRTLPPEPAAVVGSVTVEGEAFHLDDVVVELGRHRVDADGAIVAVDGLVGTDMVLDVAVPDLSEIDRFVADAGVAGPYDLPPEPFGFSGRVSVHDEGYRLHDARIEIKRAEARVEGVIGPPPEFFGSDLHVEARGPDGVPIAMITGLDLPPRPLEIRGRVERVAHGYVFHDAVVHYGEYHVELEGTLGEPPKLIGTDLELGVRGPSLEFAGSLAGREGLPDEPFRVAGRFEGTPTRFSIPRLEVRLGPSDLQGSAVVDLEGKPYLEGRFTSDLLDFRKQGENKLQERDQEGEQAEPREKKAVEKGALLISDEPFDLEALDKLDLDLRWTIDELILAVTRLDEVGFGIRLEDGAVVLDLVEASVDSGGDIAGRFELEPVGESFAMGADLKVDRFMLRLVEDEADASTWTPFDVDLKLDATGRSPHELASTISGKMLVTVGKGLMDNSLVDLVVADVLVKLLESLNPFRKEEPYTRLDCGVFSVTFTDGVANLGPLALQTDKMTMVGDGRIRFESEKLSLDWVTKPKKGIGVSASMLTNPYIKIGGTLSDPSIEMKPLEALTTTGAAVATAGLTLLGRGLWDRITAEKDVCVGAVKKMDKQAKKQAKQEAKNASE
jgi:uncharacterized protein involved in outer membrane biogenesis